MQLTGIPGSALAGSRWQARVEENLRISRGPPVPSEGQGVRKRVSATEDRAAEHREDRSMNCEVASHVQCPSCEEVTVTGVRQYY